MTRPHVPAEILDLAHRRRAAREAKDWREADALRAAMEADGWTVIDHGVDFDLRPLRPPDVVEGEVVRYGSSASVPSRLDETASAPATIVLVAASELERAAQAARAVDAEAMDGSQVVVVADGASAADGPLLAALEADGIDVVRTATRLGPAGAINAGVRQARGAIVIVLSAAVEITGDIALALEAPFRDPTVGVAGGWGVAGADLRHLGAVDGDAADAIDLACLAFRRLDYAQRGPLDERLRTDRWLGTWWSLVLRDEGDGVPPRRAAVVALPAARPGDEAGPTVEDGRAGATGDKAARRDLYRLLDRFGGRTDLLSGAADPVAASASPSPGSSAS